MCRGGGGGLRRRIFSSFFFFNEGEWIGPVVNTRTRTTFLATGETCMAIHPDLLQALKGQHLPVLG